LKWRSLLFLLVILHPSYIAHDTSATVSPRRLLCLLSVLSSPFSTVKSCSLSQLHQTATASGLNAPYFPFIVILQTPLHLNPSPIVPPSSSVLWSSRSRSHESTLMVPAPGLSPISVFFHEFEHVHHSIVFERDFEVSPVSRSGNRDVFGFQLSHHSLSLSTPLSAFEQEAHNSLL
jgi:hypothetical protein